MIETIVGINTINEDHILDVMAYMKTNGEATIRAIRHGELILVLEGSHRLEAANRLEMVINIKIINKNDEIETSSLDIDIEEGMTVYKDLIPSIGNGLEYQYSELHNLIFE